MNDNAQAQFVAPPPETDCEPSQARLRTWRWGHAFGLLGLVAAVVAYYFDYLTGRGFIWEDLLRSYYPQMNYLCSALASGRFPLWQPGLMNGIPFYTDIQTALYYPFTWLMVPFVREGALPILAFQWFIVLHILMGGVFMYVYLQHHRLRPLACLAGSMIFCFSGFAALHVIHLPMLEVFAWLPLQFLFVDKLFATRQTRYYAWLTLVIFLSFVAGFPQTTLYNSYLVVLYWLYRAHQALPGTDRKSVRVVARQLGRELARMGGVYLSVLLLGAIIILPTAQNWERSQREKWDFTIIAHQSMAPHYLLQFAVPNYLGISSATSKSESFWGYNRDTVPATGLNPGCWQYWEFGGYASQLALIALAGVLFQWGRFRQTPVRFLVVAGFLALWFMLGRYGGLFEVLYHVAPGVALFRGPARMAGVLDFCLATVAAFWLHSLLSDEKSQPHKPVTFILAMFVLGIGGYFWVTNHYLPGFRTSEHGMFAERQAIISFWFLVGTILGVAGLRVRKIRWLPPVAMAGLVACLGGDLYHAYGFFHRGSVNPVTYYNTNAGLLKTYKQLVSVVGPMRIAQGVDTNFPEILVEPNIPLLHRELETSQGYLDLIPRATAALGTITNQSAVLDLQNIGLVVGANSHSEQGIVQCRNQSLPRALFYNRIKAYESDQEILRDLDSGALNYRQTVAVRSKELSPGFRQAERPVDMQLPHVKYISESPERYRIRYSVDSPGIVFVSESFYPGWEAIDSDGQPLPIIRAFTAFKGIVLSKPGIGEITVQFRPPVFRLGAGISASTVLGLIWFYLALGRREKARLKAALNSSPAAAARPHSRQIRNQEVPVHARIGIS